MSYVALERRITAYGKTDLSQTQIKNCIMSIRKELSRYGK